MRFFLFLALIIAVAIIVFTAQNQQDITLTFFSWNLTYQLPVMLALPFFVGAIAGIGLVVPVWMKKSKAAKAFKKRIHELEAELSSLSEETKDEEPREGEETEAVQIEQTGTEEKVI